MAMGDAYLIPAWFLGFDTAMQLIFGMVTLLVAAVAFRIYRISSERTIRHFSIAFLLLALSYGFWALLTLELVKQLNSELSILSLENLAIVWIVGHYAHMLLFVSGLALLVYATLGVKNGGVYYLLFGLSATAIAASLQKLVTFRIVSMFLLSILAYTYYWEYRKRRNLKTLAVCVAFTLLFVSSINLIFAQQHSLAYVAGHVLQLVAYGLIFATMVRYLDISHSHEQKKKSSRNHP